VLNTVNINHYRRFLKSNGYPISADDRDVVHTVRAIMKVRFPCGWRESFVASGGVLLSGVEQNKPDGETK